MKDLKTLEVNWSTFPRLEGHIPEIQDFSGLVDTLNLICSNPLVCLDPLPVSKN